MMVYGFVMCNGGVCFGELVIEMGDLQCGRHIAKIIRHVACSCVNSTSATSP